MKKNDFLLKDLKRGIFSENPIFITGLGLCPTLAITTSVKNAIGMGLATTFVLFFSNIFISLLKNIIDNEVRIPSFIIVIAGFVTIVQMAVKAYFPELDKSLGIYIPLIVVNCIILGRAEVYASKNTVLKSMIDGIVIGIGFTLALILVAGIREILGSNKLYGLMLIPGFKPAAMMILPPGGFLTIGLILVLAKKFSSKK